MLGFLGAQVFTTHLPRTMAAMRRPIVAMLNGLRSLFRREDGSIAIEFAILAPILCAGVIFTAMVGIQMKHYIYAQQIVRAGQAAAVTDPGLNAVMDRMRAVAIAKGYTVASNNNPVDQMILTVGRTCFCRQNPDVSLVCGSPPCPDNRPLALVYDLTAQYADSRTRAFLLSLTKLLNGGMGIANVLIRSRVMIR